MEQAPCISQIATLLADPKRTAMIWALMDGSAKPSEELAMRIWRAWRPVDYYVLKPAGVNAFSAWRQRMWAQPSMHWPVPRWPAWRAAHPAGR